jgi:hypothetical protein
MRVADLIIIYFALGSPMGVYALTGDRRPLSSPDLFRSLLRYVLWPLAAAVSVTRWLLEDPSVTETAQRDRLLDLREQIEAVIYRGRSSPDVFAFRDLFERYAALTLSLDSDPYSHPQLALTGHTSKVAAACIYRRERARINFHQEKARLEFTSFVVTQCSEPRILDLALQVAELLGDRETAEAVALLHTSSMPPPVVLPQAAP